MNPKRRTTLATLRQDHMVLCGWTGTVKNGAKHLTHGVVLRVTGYKGIPEFRRVSEYLIRDRGFDRYTKENIHALYRALQAMGLI